MSNRFKKILDSARKDKMKKSPKLLKSFEEKDKAYKLLGFSNEESYFEWCLYNNFMPSSNKTDLELQREKEQLKKDRFDSTLKKNNIIKKISPKKLIENCLNKEPRIEVSNNIIKNFYAIVDLNVEDFYKFVMLFPSNKNFYDNEKFILNDYRDRRTNNGSIYNAVFNIFNYSEHWVRSIETWNIPKTKRIENIINSLIEHLFFKYEAPLFLISVFYLEVKESNINTRQNKLFSMVIDFAKSGNFRNALKNNSLLPVLSKKEYHQLFNFSKFVTFERAFNDIYLFSKINNKNIINEYLKSRYKSVIPDSFMLDFLIYIDNQTMFDVTQLWPLYDYILNLKHNYERENKVFHLKGRSLIKLLEGMEAWHKDLGKTKHDYEWEKSEDIQDYFLEIKNKEGDFIEKTISIFELTNSGSLRKEGRTLNHCVSSYARSCKNGNCTIWSFREKISYGSMKAILTIEVRNGTIVQVRGKSNRAATQSEMNHVRKWARENSLGCNV